MKCPKCNGSNTKKVSVIDPKWQCNHQRCKDCGYQDYWIEFCDGDEWKEIREWEAEANRYSQAKNICWDICL